MAKYLADDGNAEIEIEAESAEEAAQEYVDGGSWGEIEKTTWIEVRTRLADDEEADWEWHTITLQPDEPDCQRGYDHEWKSPYSVLGGIKENPGVWGKGGGVIIREVCANCGCYRVTDTWAQNPSNGVQGLKSISYEDADDASTEWIQSRREAVEEG